VDEWVRYFRDRERPVEAMHAHFDRHTYHRHAHETYSFGLTEAGAQAFTCRGGAHTSAAGMVMAFNPDEPHDGWSATPGGFTYRMVHIGPSLISRVLADAGGPRVDRPLFADPVLVDPVLARTVARLHESLTESLNESLKEDPLRHAEVLTSTVLRLVQRGATKPPRVASLPSARSTREIAARTRAVLAERFAEPVTADELAAAADASRYAVYRAFQSTYGLSPSDFQRQLRLRLARELLGAGRPAAEAAAMAGFADQAHLTRWFVRCFGVTPSAYRVAASRTSVQDPAAVAVAR
jgi:AraC-like DNA-binding protein